MGAGDGIDRSGAKEMESRFIAVDWGTTSFRGYLADAGGEILARCSAAEGILAVQAGEFDAVLERHIGDWPIKLPVLASGMIGSKQGWVEAPYCSCSAGLTEIADALKPH